MQEQLNFPIKIAPEESFSKPSEFIPPKAYARAGIELRKKTMVLPDLEVMRKTTVTRIIARERFSRPEVIARSDRVNAWPKDFQLRDGDCISIFPLPW